MSHLYPLLLTPIYKEMLWGGNRLNKIFNRNSPYEKTGESWDVSCRPNEMCIIENGIAAGTTFEEYIAQDKTGVLGTRPAKEKRFPLLVKLIDANDVLSVQVHPDDNYARRDRGTVLLSMQDRNKPFSDEDRRTVPLSRDADTGKTEMWYILTPPTDGHLIIGLKPGVTQADLRTAFEKGKVEDCLYRLPVAAGDIVNIPAGLVHALTPGAMVAEVQQNSDITYRLYDYNRKGLDGNLRQLHVEDALAVADFQSKIPKATVPGLSIKNGGCIQTYAIANQYFAVIKYELAGSLEETSDPAAFCIFTCMEGEAEILSPMPICTDCPSETVQNPTNKMASHGNLSTYVPAGRSVFIPAGLGNFTLRAKHRNCVLLKSFVPDIEKDFITPLKNRGYTDKEIATYTATV